MTRQRSVDLAIGERRRADEALVRGIPQPKFTDTWHPFSHATILDAVGNATEKLGLKVARRSYSLDKTGANMFGIWEVGKRDGKIACIGFRNSVNKKLTVGFCGMFTVIFCTNQISQGKFFQLRMHTAQLTVDQLTGLAEAAVSKVMVQLDQLNEWHEGLRDFRLSSLTAERLVIKAMREDVLAPRRFTEFDKIFFGGGDAKPVYDTTLYGFHGALTQIIREHSLHVINIENARITHFVEETKALLASDNPIDVQGEVL